LQGAAEKLARVKRSQRRNSRDFASLTQCARAVVSSRTWRIAAESDDHCYRRYGASGAVLPMQVPWPKRCPCWIWPRRAV